MKRETFDKLMAEIGSPGYLPRASEDAALQVKPLAAIPELFKMRSAVFKPPLLHYGFILKRELAKEVAERCKAKGWEPEPESEPPQPGRKWDPIYVDVAKPGCEPQLVDVTDPTQTVQRTVPDRYVVLQNIWDDIWNGVELRQVFCDGEASLFLSLVDTDSPIEIPYLDEVAKEIKEFLQTGDPQWCLDSQRWYWTERGYRARWV